MRREPGETIGDLKKRLAKQKREAPDPAREARNATEDAKRSLGGMQRKSRLYPGRHKG